MFAGPRALDRLRIYEDCRVIALAEDDPQPLVNETVPLARTIGDYRREREDLPAQAAKDIYANVISATEDQHP